MRNFLTTTAAAGALACAGVMAAGPASAADMLSVGLGGYMQQWIGVSDLDNNAAGSGGVSQYSDSEFYVRGALEADNGLRFSVKFELEGNTHADVIDESQATISGSFGQIVLGSEDDPAALMHYSVQDVGVGLACGDPSFINGLTTCARSGGKGLGTAGWIIAGDSQKIAYYTPRMSGVQLGLSYSPESVEDSGAGKPVNNDNDAVALGLNYQGDMGDASVALSIGHYQRSQVGASEMLKSGTNDDAITVGTYMENVAAIEAYDKAVAGGTDGDLAVLANDAAAAAASNKGALDTMASKADDHVFTNFGIRVGMGSFGFSAAYLQHDGGK